MLRDSANLFFQKRIGEAVEHERLRPCRFEAKGTTQSYDTSNSQAKTGKTQTAQIMPVSGDVSVRCCSAATIMQETATKRTRLLLLDPPEPVGAIHELPLQVHLSRDRILEAAATRRFRERAFGEITTLFRGPQGEQLTLTRKPYIDEKRHGWLNIG